MKTNATRGLFIARHLFRAPILVTYTGTPKHIGRCTKGGSPRTFFIRSAPHRTPGKNPCTFPAVMYQQRLGGAEEAKHSQPPAPLQLPSARPPHAAWKLRPYLPTCSPPTPGGGRGRQPQLQWRAHGSHLLQAPDRPVSCAVQGPREGLQCTRRGQDRHFDLAAGRCVVLR